MIHTHVGAAVIHPGEVIERVLQPRNGGIATFLGVVRDHADGETVLGLEYSAYAAMASRELAAIAAEAARMAKGADIAAVHRIGALRVGEISVAIAVGHPHRGPAFEACRYVIEQIKARVPIWKREKYARGDSAWVDPTVEPIAREQSGESREGEPQEGEPEADRVSAVQVPAAGG